MLTDFKLYYKAIVIKTVCFRHTKDLYINGTEERAQKYLHMDGQLTYGKGAQNTRWGKDSLFDKWCWENWLAT